MILLVNKNAERLWSRRCKEFGQQDSGGWENSFTGGRNGRRNRFSAEVDVSKSAMTSWITGDRAGWNADRRTAACSRHGGEGEL